MRRVARFADLIRHTLQSILEALETFAKALAKLRQLSSTKQKQGNDKYHENVPGLKFHNAASIAIVAFWSARWHLPLSHSDTLMVDTLPGAEQMWVKALYPETEQPEEHTDRSSREKS